MRVVSLLPAATEIVAALGRTDDLVAVSHECDFPPEVTEKPRATRCEIHGNRLPSAAIDDWVRTRLHETGTLYTMDEALLRSLAPDVILTQKLCDVCAVGYDSVTAFAATLPGPPRVVNLEPLRLGDVFQDVLNVGAALDAPAVAARVVGELQARVNAVKRRTAALPRRRCVLLEWIDPPYRCGHWGPDVVAAAGGVEMLGVAGTNAAPITWDAVREARPEVLVVACCGFDVTRTLADLPILHAAPGWDDLPAVQRGDVWILDGSAYVSRPGPRLADTVELLAQCLHPDVFGTPPAEAVVRASGIAG
jgi:iron complex transport system substrate-binding protein